MSLRNPRFELSVIVALTRAHVEWGAWCSRFQHVAFSPAQRFVSALLAVIYPALMTARAIPAAIDPSRRFLTIFTVPARFVLNAAWIFGQWLEYLSPRHTPEP